MRLDKYLQKNGYGTKEMVHQYIQESKIKVNKKAITDFHFQVQENDFIQIDNDVPKFKEYIYLIMNKEEGYVSSCKDKNNKTIFNLLPKEYQNIPLNIVGRLDKDVTGLILLTNNNKLYKYLTSPKNHIEKKYLVEFSGDAKYIDQDLEKGIILDDGTKTSPLKIEFIAKDKAIITITEGRFHEVKNIFLTLHMQVTSLKRLSIASLSIQDLTLGQVRELTTKEINSLLNLMKQ